MAKRLQRAEVDTMSNALLNKDVSMQHENREYGHSDMNWKDTGDEVTDPSIEGYNAGYNYDPYQFHWVNVAYRNILHLVKDNETLEVLTGDEPEALQEVQRLNRDLLRRQGGVIKPGNMLILKRVPNRRQHLAADFTVTDYSYLPEQMAREFLTIWNGVDSTIQDFYNGFVMNRFTNEMREGLANTLRQWGYEITPRYEDRTPKYAALKQAYRRYLKVVAKAYDEDDAEQVLDYFKEIFPNSYACQLLGDAVKDIREHTGKRVALVEAGGILDYYKAIYPDDYANALIDISLDKGPFMGFQEFIDVQLTRQDIERVDLYDSETMEPAYDMVRGPSGNEYGAGQANFAWDPITDLRSDTGFPASTYETTGRLKPNKLKRLSLKKNKQPK